MHRRTLPVAIVVLLAVALLVFRAIPVRGAATLPADFSDGLIANLAAPTALAFTPDGRLLITQQGGQLRIYKDDTLLNTAALNLSAKLCTNSERGLLGIAVDPQFTTNRYIYLYYTFDKYNTKATASPCPRNTTNTPVNRVTRWTLGDNNVVDPASEKVLIDNIPSPNGNHNAGDLQFGQDGYLYISVGDGGCDYADATQCAGSNNAARDQHILLGKILRITADGGIPGDNPYATTGDRCNTAGRTTAGRTCQETYAWGLRNPFRMAFDPNARGTKFFINDVGQNTWEEVDQGQPGADYGWNVREGPCANNSTTNCGAVSGMTNPIYSYDHSGDCDSITGGAFVPNGFWPAAYNNAYLFGDYVCGKILKLAPNGSGGWTQSDFLTGLGVNSATTIMFGPYNGSRALYYTTYGGSYSGSNGQVRRVMYTAGANRAPTAVLNAAPTSGATPLTVSFDGSGSSDPDNDPLATFTWNFGDGSAEQQTSVPTTSYTYASAGIYTATLIVRDSRGAASAPVAVRIDAGNSAPIPTITAPTTSDRFAVGQSVTLRGSASDADDGALGDAALSWRVVQHHNAHTHPFLGPQTGNNITFTAPAPEDLAAITTSYLEILLTATDSQGLSTTITRRFDPQLVDVTLQTSPPGLKLQVNDATITAPTTLTSWAGYALNVAAGTQTDSAGQTWEFVAWSDGGAAAHAIITPATPAAYTATFRAAAISGTGLTGQYFDNSDFTSLKLTRVDPTIDFSWGSGAPASGVGADSFSVRWTGQIVPRFSEVYTFYTVTDDGVRLYVDGKQVINDWTRHAAKENQGTIALQAGRKYAITVEYFDGSGGATARLLWASASQAREVVPQSRLFPFFVARVNFQPSSAPVPAGYLVDRGSAYGGRANGYIYGWNADNSANVYDRNSANAPDQRYDTLAGMQKSSNPNASWQIAVPNGTYTVRIVAGDPSYYGSVFKTNVESTLVVNGTPTSSNRWIDATATIAVSDGKLTISNASGASNNKICFVEITGQ